MLKLLKNSLLLMLGFMLPILYAADAHDVTATSTGRASAAAPVQPAGEAADVTASSTGVESAAEPLRHIAHENECAATGHHPEVQIQIVRTPLSASFPEGEPGYFTLPDGSIVPLDSREGAWLIRGQSLETQVELETRQLRSLQEKLLTFLSDDAEKRRKLNAQLNNLYENRLPIKVSEYTYRGGGTHADDLDSAWRLIPDKEEAEETFKQWKEWFFNIKFIERELKKKQFVDTEKLLLESVGDRDAAEMRENLVNVYHEHGTKKSQAQERAQEIVSRYPGAEELFAKWQELRRYMVP